MSGALGIDLSLTGTGIALSAEHAVTVQTKPADGDRRLNHIRDAVAYYATRRTYGLAVLEDMIPGAARGGSIAMVHGAVRVALTDLGIPYALVHPSTLKLYATGSGRADKAAMLAAAQQYTTCRFADDNATDAWWLRQMGLDATGRSTFALPDRQRACLKTMEWKHTEPHRRARLQPAAESRSDTCGHGVPVFDRGGAGAWLHAFSLDPCDHAPDGPGARLITTKGRP